MPISHNQCRPEPNLQFQPWPNPDIFNPATWQPSNWIFYKESLANARVNVQQHCVSLSCLCNTFTQIEWVADFSLGDQDSENIASERYENRHIRQPLSCLTPHISRTHVNICITLISLKSTFTRLHFRR